MLATDPGVSTAARRNQKGQAQEQRPHRLKMAFLPIGKLSTFSPGFAARLQASRTKVGADIVIGLHERH
jgi:hypothetical protein